MSDKYMSVTASGTTLSGEFEKASRGLPTVAAQDAATPSPIQFDASRYMSDLDDLEMSETQKQEFLKALWSIMTAFVDLGFGVDSVIPMLRQKAFENSVDALEQAIPKHEFNVAVDDGALEP